MPLNSRMHPRNIYRIPPNFKELAIKYPEFRKYVKQELSGRMSLDYNDRKAVSELTRILLLKDFNLKVEINEVRLIPRVPLCLNYVLWVEDLMSNLSKNDVRGIDIGTGSVAIYSLLGATRGWSMLATEIDRTSFDNAVENVNRNNLNEKITVKFVENTNTLLVGVIDENLSYDFSMCNPPFFDFNDKASNRTRKRKMIDTVASYVNTDVVTAGGEFEFIKKLIKESQYLGNKVKIYTTLIGKKSDLINLKKEILKVNPASVTDTEFCQGRTTRWALAWSFCNIKLQSNKRAKPKKSEPKSFQHLISSGKLSFKHAVEKMKKMLKDLKICYGVEYTCEKYVFTLRAYKNTWSYQRQRNRLRMKCNLDGTDVKVHCNNNLITHDTSKKRIKLNEDLIENVVSAVSPKIILVECLLSLTQEDENIKFQFSWLSGNKEYVHQIFQYFRNNWNKIESNVEESTKQD